MVQIQHWFQIKTPKSEVHPVISSAYGLKKWWTPTIINDLDESIRLYFGPDYYKRMVLISANQGIIEWECLDAVEEWVGTKLIFELSEDSKFTNVLFKHIRWKDYTHMFARCNHDWVLFFRSLRKYCETGKGHPFPNHTE